MLSAGWGGEGGSWGYNTRVWGACCGCSRWPFAEGVTGGAAGKGGSCRPSRLLMRDKQAKASCCCRVRGQLRPVALCSCSSRDRVALQQQRRHALLEVHACTDSSTAQHGKRCTRDKLLVEHAQAAYAFASLTTQRKETGHTMRLKQSS